MTIHVVKPGLSFREGIQLFFGAQMHDDAGKWCLFKQQWDESVSKHCDGCRARPLQNSPRWEKMMWRSNIFSLPRHHMMKLGQVPPKDYHPSFDVGALEGFSHNVWILQDMM